MTATTTKTCFKCGAVKPLAEFYRHPETTDGHLGKCKECTRRDVAASYRAHIDDRRSYERKRSSDPLRRAKQRKYIARSRLNSPERPRARSAVTSALRSGVLRKRPCEVCGTTVHVEAHHPDYSRPLDVQWLCFEHHRQYGHGQQPAASASSPAIPEPRHA